jgi:hypothetical protein
MGKDEETVESEIGNAACDEPFGREPRVERLRVERFS